MGIARAVLGSRVAECIGIACTHHKLVGKVIEPCGFGQAVLEILVDVRERYIIDVEKLEDVPRLHIASRLPNVAPPAGEDGTLILRSRLEAIAQLELRRGAKPPLGILAQEGEDEAGEGDACLRP